MYLAEIEGRSRSTHSHYPAPWSACLSNLGSSIHANIQARPALTAVALLAHLAKRLVAHKRPRTIEFVDEPLRNEAGKVCRSQQREERIARRNLAYGAKYSQRRES
ncbi:MULTISPECIES: hypothetical protein [unclassified Bradyrhizobium]|uniref:hypothetical protein n=1 Tax=unclassified Bradyrhizobium TaxID=2631580 RepID=UPI001FF84AAC|nr:MULTISPECIES: hypothetical protein [unclassified Bradyrhizobium]